MDGVPNANRQPQCPGQQRLAQPVLVDYNVDNGVWYYYRIRQVDDDGTGTPLGYRQARIAAGADELDHIGTNPAKFRCADSYFPFPAYPMQRYHSPTLPVTGGWS